MELKKEYVYCFIIGLIVIFSSAYFLTNTITGGNHALTSAALDDSWIHYVYAKNFADYAKFYYNYGELEAGSTSPLWVVLLAVPLKLGFEPVIPSKVLGIIFDIILGIYAFKLVKHFLKNDYAALGVSILTVLSPYLLYFRVSGMEVSLFASLILVSTYYFFKKKYNIAGVMLGLSILARPEGYVLLGVLSLLSVFEIKKKKFVMFLRKKVIRMVIIALLISAPWNLYTLAVTGRPLPNTFYVKSNSEFNPASSITSFNRVINTIHVGSNFLGQNLSLIFNLGIGALIVLSLYLKIKGKNVDSIKLILAPFLIIALMTLVIDYNFLGRYYDPFIPLIFVSLSFPLVSKNKIIQLTSIIILSLIGLSFFLNMEYFSNLQAISCMNIYDLHETMGKYVRDNIPESAVVSTPDAGAIKYFINNPVCDIIGLNTHEKCNMTDVDYRIDWPAYGDPYSDISEIIFTVTTSPNVVAASDELTLYKLNWT